MNERYLCIHGHFYQPPRQNPWLERLEVQDSAAPFHDWNERVTAECYAPNAAARILDGEGKILDIVNTYAHISFNFGPTLLGWLEQADPTIYHQILAADRASQAAYGGHGNAIAQCYNHLILPLANRRDRTTQVLWGIRDFEARFGRSPEGMWLPETAVDVPTLETLAEQGIRYTILAPHQATRVRTPGAVGWTDASNGRIDPSRPYRCVLPSGREIALFFYDGPIARAIAFEGVLARGEGLIERLLAGFQAGRTHVQLLHVATDGETYGHHHRFGEMALAYALRTIAAQQLATLTNYGQYLERFPPDHLVEIAENTSWSCIHGIERWRSDCGCQTGGKPGWQQRWRRPLREALDWLRDRLGAVFVDEGSQLLIDPWAARDDYIAVVLDRSRSCVERFFQRHARRPLSEAESVRSLKLLEMQRHALLMYASCAWFFAEISGIETVQTLAYAGRAMQLAEEVAGRVLEAEFLERLARAPSNQPHRTKDGCEVYLALVKPAAATGRTLTAEYAMRTLFETDPPRQTLPAYEVYPLETHTQTHGDVTLATGWTRLQSRITWESFQAIWAVLHQGGHDLRCWVRNDSDLAAYTQVRDRLFPLVSDQAIPEVVGALDLACGVDALALMALPLDAQQALGRALVAASLDRWTGLQRAIDAANRPFMHFLQRIHLPIPGPLRAAAEVALNVDLAQAVKQYTQSQCPLSELVEAIRMLQEDAKRLECHLDLDPLQRAFAALIQRHVAAASQAGEHMVLAQQVIDAAERLHLGLNLWGAQNLFWRWLTAAEASVTPPTALDLGIRLGFNRAAVEKLLRTLPIERQDG